MHKKKRKRRSRAVPILLLVLLLAIVGGGLYAGYAITNGEKNLPGVHVGGIDVGALTREETLQKLKTEGWEPKTLTVTTLGEQRFTADPVEAGLMLSPEEAADAAHAYGRGGSWLENLLAYARGLTGSVDVNAAASRENTAYLKARAQEGIDLVTAYMGEEEYTVDPEAGTLTMKKGWGQLKFDQTDFARAIGEALRAGETELRYEKLDAALRYPDFEGIYELLHQEPSDARYTDDGRFEVIDETVGYAFDIDQAKALWDGAAPGETVVVPLTVTRPAVTGEALRGQLYRDLLGACTTKFPNSGEARRNNLQLASSKLNGVILYPGETLSYNETVGQRTEEAGFLPAPAYVDGAVKDEIGGGACQVSSTLYCATVFAFLETVERENHYFPVNYMQIGTDATVTIPESGRVIDFKFRNNKSYPIKLVAIYNNDESSLTFEIWGTLEEGDYMPLEFDNSYTWVYDYDRVLEPADPGRPGYKIKLTVERYNFSDDNGAGYRTLTHREVYNEAGELVSDEIINAVLPNGNYAMDTYYNHDS